MLWLNGKPDIFNTDQGSQFTGTAFTGAVAGNSIAISMNGKGLGGTMSSSSRLWRGVKYVYLKTYDSVGEALR